MVKDVAYHLEESKKIREKLIWLSTFIHEHIAIHRIHHVRAVREIETELMLNVHLLESDAIITQSEKYNGRTMTRMMIDRRKLVQRTNEHLTIVSQWVYGIHTKKK
ncbi:hypothetical protein EAY39_15180 [Vibrio anguillarum]|uniref:hypothetical protein n=1 Tax=Vibrio anguillarum TaxID=55601 RepID=UPI00188BE745|nr:hypothetical protein [Vibrio anguillarum]MBF4250646.1 hypothetical protein [Vibrio anguillarum]MBF4307155.1 hypothetical protein [Vibrio anguillarum]MBF4342106.1 hypothetical protein [Vibrio anguillarum]MBF4370198.1 hypothetical protein [Vibrio anguillarum]